VHSSFSDIKMMDEEIFDNKKAQNKRKFVLRSVILT